MEVDMSNSEWSSSPSWAMICFLTTSLQFATAVLDYVLGAMTVANVPSQVATMGSLHQKIITSVDGTHIEADKYPTHHFNDKTNLPASITAKGPDYLGDRQIGEIELETEAQKTKYADKMKGDKRTVMRGNGKRKGQFFYGIRRDCVAIPTRNESLNSGVCGLCA